MAPTCYQLGTPLPLHGLVVRERPPLAIGAPLRPRRLALLTRARAIALDELIQVRPHYPAIEERYSRGSEIGGGAEISVQSMTATKTQDVDATARQAEDLRRAGAGLVRKPP